MKIKIGKFSIDTNAKEDVFADKQAFNNPTRAVGSWTVSYDGEKNLGEMGIIKNYLIDYDSLRARSWQLYLESEVCQMVFRRYSKWVIGNGLKLQAEPQKEVLSSEGIKTFKSEDFNKTVESRWKVFSNSKMSDFSNIQSLNLIAKEAFMNAIVAGDCLVVLRYVDGVVKVQLIDAAHVVSPNNFSFRGNDYIAPNGNRVRSGVEIDAAGKHVAYYVRKYGFETERIEAVGKKSGVLMAFLVYGLEYRIDNIRGIPLISSVMESAKKLDRYKEATVGSAEERQKIAYSIEHTSDSTGESPLLERAAKANGYSQANTGLATTIDGNVLADNIAVTTNKQTFNMPIGSSLKSLESKNELYFAEFYNTVLGLICAVVGIPPEVALSKYDSNFSASRAALKDWEHTLQTERKDFADQFYQPIYNFWLETEILKNKVQAIGYLNALKTKNIMALEAYRNSRWVGANVPHIDPLKEVLAEREKLGEAGKHLPLTTLEAATEALNGGESNSNLAQYSTELENAEILNIKPQEIVRERMPQE